MTNQIQSANKASVAYLPLNLQFFAEGDEDNQTDDQTNDQTDDTTDQDDQSSDQDTGVNDSDVADQDDDRDYSKDSAFADLRRKQEAAENKAQELETKYNRDRQIATKYGKEYGVYSEEDIAKTYGDRGINTLEDLEKAIERQSYEQAGLPKEVIDKLNKIDELEKSTNEYKTQSEKEKLDRLLIDEFSELRKEYSDLVKEDGSDLTPDVWTKWNDGKNGLTLTEAYELTNKKAIREHLVKRTSQEKLNQINGKAHVKGTGNQSGNVESVNIPPETMAAYKKMTPGLTDQQYMEHYKKSQKSW
jgi:multidrug efflux pump subunit AcrA (membrane-fusion protein)